MSWFWHKTGARQVLDSIEAALAAAHGGESVVLAACFENQLKGSGKWSLMHHKAVELLTLLRTINTVVPDAFFCFFAPPSPFPLLTSLIWNPSRNSGGRRGRTHQLVMYSQCREKREGRLSNVWNTLSNFLGPGFLFFGGKIHEPLNQSFTRPGTAPLAFLFLASSCVLLFLLSQIQCWEPYGERCPITLPR